MLLGWGGRHDDDDDDDDDDDGDVGLNVLRYWAAILKTMETL